MQSGNFIRIVRCQGVCYLPKACCLSYACFNLGFVSSYLSNILKISLVVADEINNDPKLKLFKCPGGKAGKGQKHRLEKEEKDCIMLYVLMNMEEVVDFIR